ncbi:Zinc/manganese transport system ATP-binding protein (modular protein) [Klebsiella quasipneumoniae subsp. similipneumoniae]|nr:Zinc/manganese transport system ATP-binding protein (modular protein) [Klebsiella quasipneumoniae subsp. similipneumoniae]
MLHFRSPALIYNLISPLYCYVITFNKRGKDMFASVFMASGAARLAIAGTLLAALWLATWWAVTLP